MITSELLLEDYRNKRILVTGSTGYLANNLIHMLKNVECQITRLARSGKILTLVEGKANVIDVIGDMTDPQLLKQILPQVDILFHFAGQSNISQANIAPAEDIRHSILPLLQLLDGCRQLSHRPHVVLASSVSLYGYPAELPVDENYHDKPQTIYDLHKLHCEQYLRYFSENKHITGCILRLCNIYGPGIDAHQFYNGLINYAIYCGLQRENIPIHGHGESQRDYLYLDDASRAFLAAGLIPDKVNNQTYIVSSGVSYTINAVIEKVRASLLEHRGIHVETITTDIETPSQIRDFRGNFTKFYQATGWMPTVNLEQGINQTIAMQ
ncbi:MAG: NAD-dependent epimerase/dehydratase family protein [Legionellales bacterium]|nr:NAD-dependent epimerase/dehydratase family protein [Legionellales bacterium]